ncbi:MAG: hypothetical protein FJY85_20980 [Deltaproteobacteria bacterium]|nr:hypothetical protein [Deltaproteobacteria bacterium]
MRNYGLIILVVVIVLGAIVYLGGAVSVGGKPVFQYLDSALGTDFFMFCHYRLLFTLTRREGSGQDEWTKAHENWEKVLRKNVE